MSVIEFILFSVTLKTSSASTVFNDFAWPLLLYKQSSITWTQQIEKQDNGFVYSISLQKDEFIMKEQYKQNAL